MSKITKIKNKVAIITLTISLLTLSIWNVNVYATKETRTSGGVGYTIAETFSDANMAQAMASQLSNGDVNYQITQTDINRTTSIFWTYKNIVNITGIEHFTNLKYLNLNSNKITIIPTNIGNLTALTALHLGGNQLTSLPDSIGNLTLLNILDVGTNLLTSLPTSIGNLTALNELRVHSNQLTSIPESIGNLTLLKKIHIDFNKITSLPDSIGNLTKLEYLSASNNQLTSLPESIGNLPSIIDLTLRQNQLTSLPASIDNLTTLKYLTISGNQFSNLSENIGNLPSLNILDVGGNKLTSLPESIGNLTTLNVLVAGTNRLTSLPESIGNLTSLTSLGLSNNELVSLPESFGNLTSLASLGLSNNQLTSLPESFANLKTTNNLYLGGNLLPTDYHIKLNTLGVASANVVYEDQEELNINNFAVFNINSQIDLDNINYSSFLRLYRTFELSTSHKYILENYVDENNQAVNIQDYIHNGIVIKSGEIFAQVRATGTGLYPNNSDNALTTSTIKLNFVVNSASTGGGNTPSVSVNNNKLAQTGFSNNTNIGLLVIVFGLTSYILKRKIK